MRDHGRILSTIWRDYDFRQLSLQAQWLYMLLLSQPNVNNAGVLPLQVSKWAKGCEHTSNEDIQAALDELAEQRYVVFDDDTEEALIRSYMRNDGVAKHPNIFKNALRCCRGTESLLLRQVLASELRRMRRRDATETADQLCQPADAIGIPSESSGMPSESHRNGEWHSNGPSILAGRGKGRGKGEPSVGGSVGEAENAPPPCPKHGQNYNHDEPCRHCKRLREYDEAHAADRARAHENRKHRDRVQAQTAVKACRICDPLGEITMPSTLADSTHVIKCPHDATEIERMKSEALAVRAQLKDET